MKRCQECNGDLGDEYGGHNAGCSVAAAKTKAFRESVKRGADAVDTWPDWKLDTACLQSRNARRAKGEVLPKPTKQDRELADLRARLAATETERDALRAEVGRISPKAADSLKDAFSEEKGGFECWCGEIHRGVYAQEDWLHHHCHHNELSPLGVADSDGSFDLICGGCGEAFSTVPDFLKRSEAYRALLAPPSPAATDGAEIEGTAPSGREGE